MSQTVVERGRVVGVWEHRRRGGKLEVTVRPFAGLGSGTVAAVTREATALARYLGGDLELCLAADLTVS